MAAVSERDAALLLDMLLATRDFAIEVFDTAGDAALGHHVEECGRHQHGVDAAIFSDNHWRPLRCILVAPNVLLELCGCDLHGFPM
jgi:hypothetical protein